MADFNTVFEQPIADTPSGASSGGADVSGGLNLEDGKKESDNSMSGLPPLINTFDLQGQTVKTDGNVDMPPVASPGTIPTGGTAE